jgi:hypothetical protein
MKRLLVVTVACAGIVGLAGCSQASIPALDAKPTGALPAALQEGHGFQPTTARKVGSTSGADFYLAKQASAPANSVCLIIYPKDAPTDWVSGCAQSDRFTVTSVAGAIEAEFIRHGVSDGDVKAGWTRVSENVVARG